jgi:hypothetical protein
MGISGQHPAVAFWGCYGIIRRSVGAFGAELTLTCLESRHRHVWIGWAMADLRFHRRPSARSL